MEEKLKVPIFLKSESLNLEYTGPVQDCAGIALPVLTSYRLRAKSLFTYLSWSLVNATSIHISVKSFDIRAQTLFNKAFLHLSFKIPVK
jgi:hypothetical protein